MAFDGTEGGEITLADASAMTAKYRRDNPNETLAHFFGKDILNRLLDRDECVGIRFYYGIDEDDNRQLVIVGVDGNENDLTDLVVDMSYPCPNACSTSNAINS